jgi:serine/threonine protein kinase
LKKGQHLYVAVKKLLPGRDNEKDFADEVKAMKQLAQTGHVHMTELLLTFSYQGSYHLMLPWADGGNLHEMWRHANFREANSPLRDHGMSKWMVKQMCGLALALKTIHKCNLDRGKQIVGSFPTGALDKVHGLHGDIKPENILWFQDPDGGIGILKVADFGLTTFHGPQSHQQIAPRGVSRSYAAPEYELKEHVSQGYDVWTFGCLLLEFVTWYLLGEVGVSEFEEARRDGTATGQVPADTFFNVSKDATGRMTAVMKQCVSKVSCPSSWILESCIR